MKTISRLAVSGIAASEPAAAMRPETAPALPPFGGGGVDTANLGGCTRSR
jgi:hypothetical protein